jgi:hypothetical protein
LPSSNVLNYIGCKIAEETKQSSNSINRIWRTLRSLKMEDN